MSWVFNMESTFTKETRTLSVGNSLEDSHDGERIFYSWCGWPGVGLEEMRWEMKPNKCGNIAQGGAPMSF